MTVILHFNDFVLVKMKHKALVFRSRMMYNQLTHVKEKK